MPENTPPPSRRVEPLDVDAVRTVQVGTALWVVALIGALVSREALVEAGRGSWIWVCFAGVVLGLLGIAVTTHRRRRLARLGDQPSK